RSSSRRNDGNRGASRGTLRSRARPQTRGAEFLEDHPTDLVKTNILALHAHPDDVEILAGGTLAQLAAGGHQITIVTMTPGDCGSADPAPDEIAAIRRAEAGRSAARIGAEYRCAEFRDLAVF